MKNTMIRPSDAIIAPVGFTAPHWVSEATTWLGFAIALITLGLYIIKFIDVYYHWKCNWKKRKNNKTKEG